MIIMGSFKAVVFLDYRRKPLGVGGTREKTVIKVHLQLDFLHCGTCHIDICTVFLRKWSIHMRRATQ